jgi:hypothetical protein
VADSEAVRVELRSGGDWLPLSDAEMVWDKLTIVEAPEGGAPEVRLDVEVSPDGVPTVREVRISTVGAGRPVRSRDIRSVRIDSLLETGLGLAVMQVGAPPRAGGESVTPSTREESARAVKVLRGRKRKLDDGTLREVAQVYRANLSRGPTLAVGERFGKRPSTAALYVKLARDRVDPDTGKTFLGAAINGKAGEQL